jgi:hypothetical protein
MSLTHWVKLKQKKLCPNPTPMSNLSHMERANNKCQSKPPSQRKACLQVSLFGVYPNNKKPKQQKRELCNKQEHVGRALNGISWFLNSKPTERCQEMGLLNWHCGWWEWMRERERERERIASDWWWTHYRPSQEQWVRQLKCCGFSIIWEIAHNSFGFASRMFFSNMHC